MVADTRRNRVLANVGLLYAAAIWGSTFVIVKDSLDHIDPVVMVAYRFTLAAVLLGVYLLATGRPLFVNWKIGALIGFFLWALYVPQTIGLGHTTASNSAFITGLFVAFVPILSVTIFRKKATWKDLIAVVISVAGLWFLTGGIVGANKGDLITLIAAATYALHILLIDKYTHRFDPYVIAFQQFFFVGIFAFATAFIFGLPFGVTSTDATLAVIFLAVFPTFSAFLIQMVAQRIVRPVRVSLIFAMEPVFAALFAWTIGGESFAWMKSIGGLLVVTAMVVASLPGKRGDSAEIAKAKISS